MKQNYPERIVDHDVLKGILKECTCKNDKSCEKHKDLPSVGNIVSVLADVDALSAHQSFPVTDSDTVNRLYRHYQLDDRSLPDVLNTESVRCEILELVSALANTNGGSIFIGITNTTTPTVEGYRLSANDEKCTHHCISDILSGGNPGPATIWGNPHLESTHYWNTFLHDVVSDGSVRRVIEIHINKCPGGMFCALPVCLDIRDTGEIHQIDSFDEWKKRLSQSATKTRNLVEESDDYHKHFESKGVTERGTSPDFGISSAGMSTIPNRPTPTASFPEFCWWASDDSIVAESLQFDQCCSQELAYSEIDVTTPFSTFPSMEAIIERHANIEHLDDTLSMIFQEHQSHNGVAVFMENLPDTTLPVYSTLKDITPVCHVFDVVILKEKLPPVIISIFKRECPKEEAKRYCLALGRLLKRHCSKCVDLEEGNISVKLFFRCKLYFPGEGCTFLQGEGYYPKDYLSPSTQTIDTVRYAKDFVRLPTLYYRSFWKHYGKTSFILPGKTPAGEKV